MPAPIVIEVTPQAQAVIVKLRNFPQEIGQAIKRGMDSAGNTAWREITIQRFSGKGPFPVEQHKLGEKSERLKQSLFYRAATVSTVGSSVSVTGTMGSEGVKYFPWHEFGYEAEVKPFFRTAKKGTKTPSLERLSEKLGGAKLKGGRQAVRAHHMSIPARGAMRAGIEDHKILFQTKIQEELEKTLNAKT